MNTQEGTRLEMFSMEFPMKTSVKILFSRLNNADGLAQWFADEVENVENRFIFKWNKEIQEAEKIAEKENSFVRYRWINEERSDNEKEFFEFRIVQDDVTRGVVLTITDFSYPDELEDNKELWLHQVEKLQRVIGSKI